MKKKITTYLTEKDIEHLMELCLIYYKHNTKKISVADMLSLCIDCKFKVESNCITKIPKKKVK